MDNGMLPQRHGGPFVVGSALRRLTALFRCSVRCHGARGPMARRGSRPARECARDGRATGARRPYSPLSLVQSTHHEARRVFVFFVPRDAPWSNRVRRGHRWQWPAVAALAGQVVGPAVWGRAGPMSRPTRLLSCCPRSCAAAPRPLRRPMPNLLVETSPCVFFHDGCRADRRQCCRSRTHGWRRFMPDAVHRAGAWCEGPEASERLGGPFFFFFARQLALSAPLPAAVFCLTHHCVFFSTGRPG